MTDTPQPQKEAAFFTAIRGWGLTRGSNGVVGGVVEGLGQRIGMAAVPARLLAVLAWLLLPGLVMLAYAAAWGLLPDRRGNIIIQNFGRGVTNVGALLGIAVLLLFGFGLLDTGGLFGVFGWAVNPFPWDTMDTGGFHPFHAVVAVMAVLIPLALIGGVVALIVWLVRRSKNPPTPGTSAPGATPVPPGAPAQDGADAPAEHGGDATVADAAATDADHATSEQPRQATDAPANAAMGAAAPSAVAAQAPHAPQPWEPALLPGDPRAGAQPSRGAVARSDSTTPPPPPSPGAPAPAAGPASAASAPQAYAAHYAPPAPPAPPKPRVPGPGKPGYLGFLGVLILSAAIVAGVDRADELAVHRVLAWGACVTVGLGALLVVIALSGRKLGFLGFLSVIAVAASMLVAGNANGIRENFDAAWGWDRNIDVAINGGASEPSPAAEPEETPIDLSAELAAGYDTIYAAGSCTTPVLMEPWEDVSLWGEETATMRLGAVTEDTAVDLDATYTHVAVPAGTSIEIFGVGDTTVIWEDRDISCYDWSAPNEYDIDPDPTRVLSATNADAPVLTLTGREGSVIYLEEVAS